MSRLSQLLSEHANLVIHGLLFGLDVRKQSRCGCRDSLSLLGFLLHRCDNPFRQLPVHSSKRDSMLETRHKRHH